MNKFKFGDVVHDEVLGKCIVLKMDGDLAVIQSESGFKANVNPDHLVKVQHPDTARLDFLIERGEAAFKQNDAGNWWAYDPHSYCQMAAAKWRGFGNSPRAAIDAAMKQSK